MPPHPKILEPVWILRTERGRRREEAEIPGSSQASASSRRLRTAARALVTLTLALIPLSVVAASRPQTNAAAVSVPLVRGFPGVTSQVPISLLSTGTLVAAQFDLAYPPAHLNPAPILNGTFGSNAIVRWRQIAPGLSRYVIYSQSGAPLQTNGLIGTLPVGVPANETVGGTLSVSNFVPATAAAALAVPAQSSSGGVLVAPIFRADDGVVYLMFAVQSNRTYIVQATTNLMNWVTLSTNLAALNYITVADPDAAHLPYRFYRLVTQTGLQNWLISNPLVLTNGSLSFQVSGPAGGSFVVQASTDLVTWSSIVTNTLGATPQVITDSAAGQFRSRFYRVFIAP